MIARRGLSIIEVSIATVLTGALLVGSMRIAGTHAAARSAMAQRLAAEFLAQHLAAEIGSRFYEDPVDPLDVFGPSATELVSGRSSFNDVDDYHGLTETPPRGPTGAALSGLTGVERTTKVEYIDTSGNVSVTATGLKRVTIVVSKDRKVLATALVMRSKAADQGRPVPEGSVIVQTIDETVVGDLLEGVGDVVEDLGDAVGGILGGLLGGR